MNTYLKNMEDGTQTVFKKMFDMVGADYEMELVSDWYFNHEWTEAQEEEFHKWFVEYHWKGDGKNGKGCLNKSAKTKKVCERGWGWFNLMYGWKLKEIK